MAKFLTKGGLLVETTDKTKIACYKAQGLVELSAEPLPIQQDIVVESDFIVRPAKKKKDKRGV